MLSNNKLYNRSPHRVNIYGILFIRSSITTGKDYKLSNKSKRLKIQASLFPLAMIIMEATGIYYDNTFIQYILLSLHIPNLILSLLNSTNYLQKMQTFQKIFGTPEQDSVSCSLAVIKRLVIKKR